MSWDHRDEDYEKHRALCLTLNGHTKLSKALRSGLQTIVLLRAGAEVAGAGAMHAEKKFSTFVEKVVAHQVPLIDELEAIAKKMGIPLPEFVSSGIKYSNAKGKKFTVVPNQAAWKKYTTAVSVMRNHVLPLFKKLHPSGPLPSGLALDELLSAFFKAVANVKTARAGPCLLGDFLCPSSF